MALDGGNIPRPPTPSLRLLFVIPWRDRGCWLWEHLPPGFAGDLTFAAPELAADSTSRRHLPPYWGELLWLAGRRPRWRDYEVVFTWELRSALATALLLRLVPRAERPKWVAVGPILKGTILRVLPLVRWLLRDAERIVCFSRAECDDYARLLRLPRDRFQFLPTPWLAAEESSDQDEGYILALGQSNRDYPTLLRAVAGTNLPVTLVASNPSSLRGVAVPPNVRIHFNTDHHRTIDLIARATFHCIPLHPTDFSAGQTVLLRAMARGKAVVVTDTPGIRDYVRDGETALLVPPGDPDAFRAALFRLWNTPDERARIGQNAARAVREEFGFKRFTRCLAEIAARDHS